MLGDSTWGQKSFVSQPPRGSRAWGGRGQRQQWSKAKGTFSPAWDRGRNCLQYEG